MRRVGIIGASGYSGETLVGILLSHPEVELACVSSRSLAGMPLGEAIPRIRGRDGGLVFSQSDPATLAARDDIDTWFLALPHGVAAEFARPLVEAGREVIDLSADFRLRDPDLYESYYGNPHPDRELLKHARYVLPDWHPLDEWTDAPLLASPGCYPTSILLPLLPLAAAGTAIEDIVAVSYSSVSGAGKKVDAQYLFCERNESLRGYGLPRHRHLSEIEEQLAFAAGRELLVTFCPHLAPINRGIHTTLTLRAPGLDADAVRACWQQTYIGRPFVSILPAGSFPDTAHTAGTNRIDIAAFDDPRTGRLILTAAEDNVVKGAGGQAVQAFNLRHGFPETAGLV